MWEAKHTIYSFWKNCHLTNSLHLLSRRFYVGFVACSSPHNCIIFLFTCCCSVAKLYPILCDPMNCSTPGSFVLHNIPLFAQIHVHWVSDAIQPSHLLSSSSPPALNLSQLRGLFQWIGALHQMAKVFELQPSVLAVNIQGWFPLGFTSLISVHSKGLSSVFPSTVWMYQFFLAQSSLWSNSHICTWLLEKL